MSRHSQLAFTLTELMIVISILALLVGIAYPSYLEHVRKTRRTDAKQTLLHTSQQLERCYSQFRRYDSLDCPQVLAGPTVDLISPDGFYRVRSVDASGTETLAPESFTLSATPRGAQAGDTHCARFVLSSAQVRSSQNSASANTTDDCW